MASSFRRSYEYPVPPERLLEMLTDPGFIEAQELSFGALTVQVTLREIPEGLEIVVDKTQPGRGPGGRKDPNRPERQTQTQRWDMSQRRCTWSQVHHKHPDRVRVSGSIQVEATTQGSQLVEQGEIGIKVPFIGRKLEKKLVAAIERKGPQFRDFILARLEALPK